MKRNFLWALALSIVAGPVAAQGLTMPDGYREVQVKQLEAQRRLLVAMADSMPANLYTDKVTPVQRDFAHQLHHAAGAVVGIGARFIMGSDPNITPDDAIFTTPSAMVTFINQVYDWAIESVRTQPAAARGENVTLFGLNMARWQVWDEIHQHTIWTAGQIVANFRKHGMAPPGFSFF